MKKILLILILILLLTGCKKENAEIQNLYVPEDYHEIKKDNHTYKYNTNLKLVLVLGIDSPDLKGQADFIELLIFDRASKTLDILNLPRETKTTVKQFIDGQYVGDSESYLNMAYPFAEYEEKGAILTTEKVSEILNKIPVNDYFVVGPDIYTDLVKIVGVKTIELPDDSLAYLNEKWVKGYPFEVNEETIKNFLQSRDTKIHNSADNRRLRQNLYIKEIESNIDEINETYLLKTAEKCLTNLSLDEIDALVSDKYKLNSFLKIPGDFNQSDYYDEFVINQEQMQSFIIDTFYTEE